MIECIKFWQVITNNFYLDCIGTNITPPVIVIKTILLLIYIKYNLFVLFKNT